MSSDRTLPVEVEGLLGKRTLVVGEAGAGKSMLLAKALERLVEIGLAREVTVIDMAPFRFSGIGGKLRDLTEAVGQVRYLTDDRIAPPRLLGKSAQEVLEIASRNAALIEPLLLDYLRSPTRILLVNDLTVYLHAGDPALIERAMETAETFIATCYEGSRLSDDKGSGVTRTERERLESLKRRADMVLNLGELFNAEAVGGEMQRGESL
ncbi:MAG: hypothetical protein QXP81_06130 [Nitrososphaerota archaeon]